MPRRPGEESSRAIAERAESALATKHLTLYQVSQRSEALYGRHSPSFVPHNLYYEVRKGAFRPSVFQMFALSQISGYRFEDWARLFGFHSEDIPRAQVHLHQKRTTLIDASLTDPAAPVRWFRNRSRISPAGLFSLAPSHSSIAPHSAAALDFLASSDSLSPPHSFNPPAPFPSPAPLGQLLEPAPPRRIESLAEVYNRGFLYAKIGSDDAFAFPDLLPGSIVRVNPSLCHPSLCHPSLSHFSETTSDLIPGIPVVAPGAQAPGALPAGALAPGAAFPKTEAIGDRFFLIEHSRGFCCCRIEVLGGNRILPVSNLLSYAQVELEFPREVRVLGVVDLEFRPLWRTEYPEIPRDLSQRWKPGPVASIYQSGDRTGSRSGGRFGELLGRARQRMNLSLREAASLTRTVADLTGADEYALSPSTLWECEVFDTPPRDFSKVMSLASIYGLRLGTLVRAMGIDFRQIGGEPMPDRIFRQPTQEEGTEVRRAFPRESEDGFFEGLLRECQEVPFFLRDSIASFSGLERLTLRDFYWMGGEAGLHSPGLYPYLENGLVAVVNRRRKRAVHFACKPVWQQPVYMIQTRDGQTLVACCGVEGRTLVLHPYSNGKRVYRASPARSPGIGPSQFQLHRDAEVVGQIVSVARKL